MNVANRPQPPPRPEGRPLGSLAQTRLSWARRVESFDDLPAVYQEFLRRDLAGAAEFPHAVLTPTFEGFFRRENERLVYLLGRQVHILERARNQVIPTTYPLEAISYVEMGSILLKGWLTIRGLAGGAAPVSTTLKYNTVTERLFMPFVVQVRTGGRALPPTDPGPERARFNELIERNYKFMNYARDSILPGEKVVAWVLQAEMRDEILRIFGRSLSRSVAPTHMAILTDRELITIREESGGIWPAASIKYGGIWEYVPLDRIAGASLAAREDGRLALAIHLPAGDRLEHLFAPAQQDQVEGLLENLRALQPAAEIAY